MNKKKFVIVNKTLFFPKERLLVIGDLHLGYEDMLRARGLDIPLRQFEEVIDELGLLLKHIKAKYGKIEWIVFLGDIKHHFGYIKEERDKLNLLLRFLKKYFEENKIIFIKGNHEKNDKNEKLLDYFIIKDIAFIHGHREILEIYDKKINLVIMGHIHPSITLEDKQKIKKERYKCFLLGRYKKKDFVIVPSFINLSEGISFKEFSDNERDFSIVPQKELKKFEVYIVQDLGHEALNFGKLERL